MSEQDSDLWESPLKQSTYMFIWALASVASFAFSSSISRDAISLSVEISTPFPEGPPGPLYPP